MCWVNVVRENVTGQSVLNIHEDQQLTPELCPGKIKVTTCYNQTFHLSDFLGVSPRPQKG